MSFNDYHNIDDREITIQKYRNKGPTGPQGPVGKTPKGLIGQRGHRGEKGHKGDTGDKGPRGLPGAPGKAGPRGAQGDRGQEGRVGATGATGATGIRGQKISVGHGIPEDFDGYINGDIYVDLETGNIYEIVIEQLTSRSVFIHTKNINDETNTQFLTNLSGLQYQDQTFNDLFMQNRYYSGGDIPEPINNNDCSSDSSSDCGKNDCNDSDDGGEIVCTINQIGSFSDVKMGPTGPTGHGIQGIQGNTGPVGPKALTIYDQNLMCIKFDGLQTGNNTNHINNKFGEICEFQLIRNDTDTFPLMIFNSTTTNTCFELATPNQDFGGNGIGNGGKQGHPGENNISLDNVLIISNDGNTLNPSADIEGGTIKIIFNEPVIISTITLINGDNSNIQFDTYKNDNTLINHYDVPLLGTNSVYTQYFNDNNTTFLDIKLYGKTAISSICYNKITVGADEIETSKYLMAYNNNEQNITTLGVYFIWDSVELSCPIYTLNNDEITFNEEGYYKIYIDATLIQTEINGPVNNSCEILIKKKNIYTGNYYNLNGTCATVNFHDLLHGTSTSSIHTIKKMNSGDTIKIFVYKNGNNTNIQTYSHGSRILIENLIY